MQRNTRANPSLPLLTSSDLPLRTRGPNRNTMASAQNRRSQSRTSLEDQAPPDLEEVGPPRPFSPEIRVEPVRPTSSQGQARPQTREEPKWQKSLSMSNLNKDQQTFEPSYRSARGGRARSTSSFPESGIEGEGLLNVLSHLTKPIRNLNTRELRDDPNIALRNLEHLKRVNATNLRSALDSDLVGVFSRLARIESEVRSLATIHKIAARVDTAKKNSILILETYPEEDAPPSLYRQASAAMASAVKNIAQTKGVSITKDSYSFVLEICLASNIVSSQFVLSEEQQFSLIIDSLPANSSEFRVLVKCTSLTDLFNSVSTLCPSIYTQRELEQKVMNWKLVTTSVPGLTKCLSDLLAWCELAADNEMKTVDIYRSAIGRVMNEKLSPSVLHALQEVRLKLSEQDSVNDLLQMLLCSLKQVVPKNDGLLTVKQIEHSQQLALPEPQKQTFSYMESPNVRTDVVYLPPGYNPNVAYDMSNNVTTTGNGKGQNKKKGRNEKQKKEKEDDSSKKKAEKVSSVSLNTSTETLKGTEENGNKKRSEKFVPPWPEGKVYLNKSGNALTAEFERHFAPFCYKCGHISHKGEACRIYKDQTAILTLCTNCRQGMHDTCKSRRFKPLIRRLESQRSDVVNPNRAFAYPPFFPWGMNGYMMPFSENSRQPSMPPISED
jgi:hypothetical protein